jgi:hypothetical protein
MKSGALVNFLAEPLALNVRTVSATVQQLQNESLISKGSRGRHGGADLTATDVTNALLALTLDHAHGAPVGDSVRRVRGLFHDEPPSAFDIPYPHELWCFTSATAGDALDGIIRDIQAGRIEAWASGEPFKLTVSMFNDGSRVFVSLSKRLHATDNRAAIQAFARAGAAPGMVERQTILHFEWFKRIAQALGPPE